jgi:hypothetical protein
MNVWSYGGPTLHKALDKLLATWKGVFPQPVLDKIAGAKMAAVQHVQYSAPASGQLKPMMPDPRLSYGSGVPQQPLHYEYPQPSTYSYPVPSTSYGPQAIPQLSVSPDLVALLSSGILSQKGGVGRMDSGKGRRRPAIVTFSQDNIKVLIKNESSLMLFYY